MSRRNRDKRTSVRGNTANYTPEKPLFGKYVGSVYRPDHERGIAENDVAIELVQSQNDPVQLQEDESAHKMFSNNECIRDNEVICPYCGDNYVHFFSPNYFQGKDNYKARTIYDIGTRGDIITIDFWCEGGHEWTLVLGEHKGQIFHKIAKTVQEDKTQEKKEQNSMISNHKEEIPDMHENMTLLKNFLDTMNRCGIDHCVIATEGYKYARILMDNYRKDLTERICMHYASLLLWDYLTIWGEPHERTDKIAHIAEIAVMQP